MPASIASTLSALRKRKGWSQEQLASNLGVSFATVNRWEGGKSHPQRVQREAIEKLAQEVLAENGAEAASAPHILFKKRSKA